MDLGLKISNEEMERRQKEFVLEQARFDICKIKTISYIREVCNKNDLSWEIRNSYIYPEEMSITIRRKNGRSSIKSSLDISEMRKLKFPFVVVKNRIDQMIEMLIEAEHENAAQPSIVDIDIVVE